MEKRAWIVQIFYFHHIFEVLEIGHTAVKMCQFFLDLIKCMTILKERLAGYGLLDRSPAIRYFPRPQIP
jgi:hypothetical protein